MSYDPAVAKHDVNLFIPREIPIGNVDIDLSVRADGEPLGRLSISKGSVDWIPSPKSQSGYRLSWEEFAELMSEHGNPR